MASITINYKDRLGEIWLESYLYSTTTNNNNLRIVNNPKVNK